MRQKIKLMTASPTRLPVLGLILILILPASLRIWGLDFGLPYLYHPDEPFNIQMAGDILKTGDLNPHFFRYPSFFFYMYSGEILPYYWIGKWAGYFKEIADIPKPIVYVPGSGIINKPTLAIWMRSFSMFNGLIAVYLAYLCGKRLTGKKTVGLLAALFMAISPAHVNNNHMITPESPIITFAMLCILASIEVMKTGSTRYYVLAALAASLSAASKYNGGFIILALVAAHFLRNGWRGWRDRRIYLSMGLAAVIFLLINPFFWLDFKFFWKDITDGLNVYTTGHPGDEDAISLWYFRFLLTTEGLIALLGLAAIVKALIKHEKDLLAVAFFPVLYFIMISFFMVRNERTLLPILGPLHVLAACMIVWLIERMKNFLSGSVYQFTIITMIGMVIALPLYQSIQNDLRYTRVDSRDTARIWIYENIPLGTPIAVERYSPFLYRSDYRLITVESMANHPPEWYIEQGAQYLVMSEVIFRRFEINPALYPVQAQAYAALMERFEQVKVFDDGGFEIWLLKVTP